MAQVEKTAIVFVRHGESEWNQKNLFCGWVDAELTKQGMKEAEEAGRALKNAGFKFDEAHTSVLQRAQKTLAIILDVLEQPDIPIYSSWRLNERHYGGLTGMNKTDAVSVYGEDQIKVWRRSYMTPPPRITEVNPFYARILNDPIYMHGPNKDEFPMYESLKMTIDRTLPYWNENIVPKIKEGRRILIVAHGNSLRGILKVLDNISNDDIVNLNIPNGIPFSYELDKNMKPIISMQFLADEDTVLKAMEAVATVPKRDAKARAETVTEKSPDDLDTLRERESITSKARKLMQFGKGKTDVKEVKTVTQLMDIGSENDEVSAEGLSEKAEVISDKIDEPETLPDETTTDNKWHDYPTNLDKLKVLALPKDTKSKLPIETDLNVNESVAGTEIIKLPELDVKARAAKLERIKAADASKFILDKENIEEDRPVDVHDVTETDMKITGVDIKTTDSKAPNVVEETKAKEPGTILPVEQSSDLGKEAQLNEIKSKKSILPRAQEKQSSKALKLSEKMSSKKLESARSRVVIENKPMSPATSAALLADSAAKDKIEDKLEKLRRAPESKRPDSEEVSSPNEEKKEPIKDL